MMLNNVGSQSPGFRKRAIVTRGTILLALFALSAAAWSLPPTQSKLDLIPQVQPRTAQGAPSGAKLEADIRISPFAHGDLPIPQLPAKAAGKTRRNKTAPNLRYLRKIR